MMKRLYDEFPLGDVSDTLHEAAIDSVFKQKEGLKDLDTYLDTHPVMLESGVHYQMEDGEPVAI